jgi:crossover junction endodeoxyribonuclease RuvC
MGGLEAGPPGRSSIPQRVLGVDPGLVDTGYGALARGAGGIEVVATGVIAAPAGLPLEARLARVYDGMTEVLDGLRPDVVVLEDLYTEYRFPRTALLMAHARGVICLAARQRQVAVVTLPPATVKRAIAASGAASKEQIQRAVQHLLGLERPPRPSHVADALALALTGLSRAGGLG